MLTISISLLGYAYAGYPALIWLLARVWGRPVRKGPFSGGVSILIAAHNEAGSLPRKLENLFALANDEPIREIWIGLDGCTDGTGEAVRERIRISNIQYPLSNVQGEAGAESRDGRICDSAQESSLKAELQTGSVWRPHCSEQPFGSPWNEGPMNRIADAPARDPKSDVRSPDTHQPLVQILEFEQQRGKAAVLNELMAKAGQPIFVMMDARQRVEPGAIGRLLENFADDQVGVVSGALVYESAEGGTQKGAESYWGYEKFLRRCESRFWAVPGATGALYAIRKELCRPIPENTLVDDVLLPMRAVIMGYRCLFEPSARVFDLPSACFDKEGARKRRTLAGIWQLMSIEPKISSIFANPIWFQLVSHKFLRLLTPFLVILAYFSLGGLALGANRTFSILFMAATILIAISCIAFWGGRRISSRLLGVLGAFCGVNLALLRAAGDAWTGRFDARWKA